MRGCPVEKIPILFLVNHPNMHVCDMIKGNESDVGNIDLELQV